MTKPYTGGCACGAVRYEITGEPIVMVDCQCRQCQSESGTGHASHVTFMAAEVKLSGEASHWDMVGDGGARFQDVVIDAAAVGRVAEQGLEAAVLEDERDDAERRGDGQRVHQDRLEGQHDRARAMARARTAG